MSLLIYLHGPALQVILPGLRDSTDEGTTGYSKRR
jgi:hypothetical protein